MNFKTFIKKRWFLILLFSCQCLQTSSFYLFSTNKFAYPLFNWDLFSKPLPVEKNFDVRIFNWNEIEFEKPKESLLVFGRNFDRKDYLEYRVSHLFEISDQFQKTIDNSYIDNFCSDFFAGEKKIVFDFFVKEFKLEKPYKIDRLQQKIFRSEKYECREEL